MEKTGLLYIPRAVKKEWFFRMYDKDMGKDRKGTTTAVICDTSMNDAYPKRKKKKKTISDSRVKVIYYNATFLAFVELNYCIWQMI